MLEHEEEEKNINGKDDVEHGHYHVVCLPFELINFFYLIFFLNNPGLERITVSIICKNCNSTHACSADN